MLLLILSGGLFWTEKLEKPGESLGPRKALEWSVALHLLAQMRSGRCPVWSRNHLEKVVKYMGSWAVESYIILADSRIWGWKTLGILKRLKGFFVLLV